MVTKLCFSTHIAAPPDFVYDWHARPGAFQRLTPPWQQVQLVQEAQPLETGQLTIFKGQEFFLPYTWNARIIQAERPHLFVDQQEKGPMAAWQHEHVFLAHEGGTEIRDTLTFELPLAPFSNPLLPNVKDTLSRAFHYRSRIVKADIEDLFHNPEPPMKIAITGASGILGQALAPLLTTRGHHVVSLTRCPDDVSDNCIYWDPTSSTISDLSDCDAVIHLAGEPIGEGRWTTSKKDRVLASRVQSTSLLTTTLAEMSEPPKVFLCANAIGYYGDRNNQLLTEDSSVGDNFTANVCSAWQKAAQPAVNAGIRTVFLRIGVVLTPAGGALARLLPPFRAGLGFTMGDGSQYLSWISMDDTLGALLHCLKNDQISGPINLTAPNPITNKEFSDTLARILHRPRSFQIPPKILRLALGKSADELLLASSRVLPSKLIDHGYTFRHTDASQALIHLTGKSE